jgi:hypothetical protein
MMRVIPSTYAVENWPINSVIAEQNPSAVAQ